MQFFIGTHQPSDAPKVSHAFISVNRLRSRKSPMERARKWIMDCAGFTTILTHGGYPDPPEAYAAEVRRSASALRARAAQSEETTVGETQNTGAAVAGPYSIGSRHWPGTSKIIEECGELMEVAGKLMGSGGDTAHWTGDLRTRLLEELADASAAIHFFAQANLTSAEWIEFERRNGVKGNRFWKWHVENGGFTRRFEQNAEQPDQPND